MAQDKGAAQRLTADVADFLGHLSAERGLAANTVSAYAADAQQFVEHLLESGHRDWVIARGDVDRYCEMLAGRGYAMSTQSRKIASVRALYRFPAGGRARGRKPHRGPAPLLAAAGAAVGPLHRRDRPG